MSIGNGQEVPVACAILTKATAGTGNFVTAERLAECVYNAAQRKCLVVEESQFKTPADFSHWLDENGVVFVLGVHAYRAGRLLFDCGVSYGIVLGGTDVNVDMQSPSPKRDVCIRSIMQALFVVAFSQEMVDRLKPVLFSCLPSASHVDSVLQNVRVVHQAVSIPQEIIRGETGLPTIHEYLGISVDVNVILLPAALRPIKDPLYLLDALRLHSSSCQSNSAANRFRLVIVGPSLDESTLHSVQEACRMLPELCTYIGVQPRRMILRWMTSSFCVANTSESEGMSGTILEAMAVGCPVVARQNAGNCNLVQHGVTGFIFSSAAQALHQCVELANQGVALRTSICNAAAECITRRHSRTSEMQAYQRLLREHNVCGSTSNTNSSV